MPKNTRYIVKRHLVYADKELENVERQLVKAGHFYHEVHPEIFNEFCLLLQGVACIRVGVKALREKL